MEVLSCHPKVINEKSISRRNLLRADVPLSQNTNTCSIMPNICHTASFTSFQNLKLRWNRVRYQPTTKPLRFHGMATSRPVPDSVTKAVFMSDPPKQRLVV